MNNIKSIFILLSVIVLLGFSSATNSSDNFNNVSNKFIVGKTDYRFWQGVASDGKYLYMTSDRNENFDLENIISIYTLDGKLVSEKRNAYTDTDNSGRFMSFGDGTIIDNFLYVPVYNVNDGGTAPYQSRVVKYNLIDLSIVAVYDIGDGVAESVAKNKGSFWVVYNDKRIIKRFNSNFSSSKTYSLGLEFNKDQGAYQGAIFTENDLYVNLHGSNDFNGEYALGLDHYKFKNGKFEFVERIKPPTYGSGQGIDYVDGYYLWADRPSNQIVMTKELDIWN